MVVVMAAEVVDPAVELAVSMDRTAAVRSQRAARMSERRWCVKAFEVSLTWVIVDSNMSGVGHDGTAKF